MKELIDFPSHRRFAMPAQPFRRTSAAW